MTDLVICHDPRVPTGLPEASVRECAGSEVRRPGLQTRRSASCNATIVVLAGDASAETELCLESILAHSADVDYEVRVVDGIHNLAALNQALTIAHGPTLVLLSGDSIVTPGWLPTLMTHLEDPAVGLVGPVTNRASNAAQIHATYSTVGQLIAFANGRGPTAPAFDIRTLNPFCVAMRRQVFELVGPFDERFDVNVFQEEDYAIRMRNAGLRVMCAPDVFIHNAGRNAIGHLTNAGMLGERFQQVRRLFEDKWAVRWYAYDHFNASDYDLLRRIRAVIVDTIPADATVLMVSKGDEELRALAPHAWHFPGLEGGTYAGHHPADSADAIARLETQRAQGAHFLLIPNSAAWWLTYYDGWRQHLETRYRAVVQDDRTCVVYDLR